MVNFRWSRRRPYNRDPLYMEAPFAFNQPNLNPPFPQSECPLKSEALSADRFLFSCPSCRRLIDHPEMSSFTWCATIQYTKKTS